MITFNSIVNIPEFPKLNLSQFLGYYDDLNFRLRQIRDHVILCLNAYEFQDKYAHVSVWMDGEHIIHVNIIPMGETNEEEWKTFMERFV